MTEALYALLSEIEGLKAERDVVAEIAEERERQRSTEGWMTAHDDEHDRYQMAQAAATYALAAAWPDEAERYVMDYRGEGQCGGDHQSTPYELFKHWPWSETWWKPKNRRRDLVRAGALIVAEIERLDRKAAK